MAGALSRWSQRAAESIGASQVFHRLFYSNSTRRCDRKEEGGEIVPTWNQLSEKHPSTPELSQLDRKCIYTGASIAEGKLDTLKSVWENSSNDEQEVLIEVILQSHLFAGYPRALNALSAVHEPGRLWEAKEVKDLSHWQKEGEKALSAIYGSTAPLLKRRMLALHPDMEAWMRETGYGRILSRPGASLLQREYGILPILVIQQVEAQLKSHLLGALRVGATEKSLFQMLGCLHYGFVGEGAVMKAEAVLRSIVEQRERKKRTATQ
mmetsp:Transcript_19966/g.51001  ORF Transcript_19966/g.51001 Transcript_19966/m.51001 type:complete len:266 (-) Transcript_19966:123-920(-)